MFSGFINRLLNIGLHVPKRVCASLNGACLKGGTGTDFDGVIYAAFGAITNSYKHPCRVEYLGSSSGSRY